MKYNSQTYRITDNTGLATKALIIGTISLLVSVAGCFIDKSQFWHSYLVAFMFWLTLALGGLFFVMLHHLANSTWSVVLRRLAENLMVLIPVMAIFFIPILFGLKNLYPWNRADLVASDELLQNRTIYLNTPFFMLRAFVYFSIWFILTRMLYNTSIDQDRGFTITQVKRFRNISAPGMILFAITLTFASFDWLLSLDAHWYSTIFGVYIFSGSVLAGLVSIAVTAIFL
jgi:hypothetical protein